MHNAQNTCTGNMFFLLKVRFERITHLLLFCFDGLFFSELPGLTGWWLIFKYTSCGGCDLSYYSILPGTERSALLKVIFCRYWLSLPGFLSFVSSVVFCVPPSLEVFPTQSLYLPAARPGFSVIC